MATGAKGKGAGRSKPKPRPLMPIHTKNPQLCVIASTTLASIHTNIAQMDREMILEALEMASDLDTRLYPVLADFRSDSRSNVMEVAARHKVSVVALVRAIREWAHACDEVADVREQWPIMRGLARDSLSLWADCPACGASGMTDGVFCKVCNGAGMANVKKSDPEKLAYYLQTRGLISTGAKVAINNNIMNQGGAPQPALRVEDIVTQIAGALTQPALLTTATAVTDTGEGRE